MQTLDSLTAAREDTLMERTKREEEFRRQYEENEKYNLTTVTSQPDVNGLILYRPTRGMVSDHFNAEKKHFGTDIAANPNESVLATMDGTVILSTYTAETGYLIGVQHNQDLISIYKHCGSLLKKEGERVKGGEAIAWWAIAAHLAPVRTCISNFGIRDIPLIRRNTLYFNDEYRE